jgi:uncharacterized protein
MGTAQEKDAQEALNSWPTVLACPVCHEPLRFAGDQITCTPCIRTYPVIDGIPVLIADRALKQTP